jgi:hypothetical protein
MNADIILTESFREINPSVRMISTASHDGSREPNTRSGTSGVTHRTYGYGGGKTRIKNCDFYLGILGCDNRVAYEAKKAGYRVTNPAYKYRAYHNHRSGVRTHRGKRLPKPYKLIKPT